MTIALRAQMPPDDDTLRSRQRFSLWGLMLALWGACVWIPQLAYPYEGTVIALITALLLGLSTWIRVREGNAASNPAAWLGFAFVAWAWIRWTFAGSPAAGAENTGTLIMCAAMTTAGYNILAAGPANDAAHQTQTSANKLLRLMLLVISASALVCGMHAVIQYFYLYDRAFQELQNAIGANEPTPLQISMLHHLRLKRVASLWGDPNTLGGFLALSLAASAELAVRGMPRWPKWTAFSARAAAGCSIACSAAGIFLSGSRGAMLDALFIAVMLGWLASINRKRQIASVLAAAMAILIFSGAAQSPPKGMNTANAIGRDAQHTSFLNRSDTLRERMNYVRVGMMILARDPIFGAAPGAVDLYYGQYKPENARETKYLHNWPLQIGVETGLTGLAIAACFLILLFWRARGALRQSHEAGIVVIMAAAFALDAFFQLSFNQREMMMLFGMLCGAMLFAGARAAVAPPGKPRAITSIVGGSALILAILFVVEPWLIGRALKLTAGGNLDAGQLPQAVARLRHAQFWTPQDPEVCTMLAHASEMTGDASAAEIILQRAIRLRPQSASIRSQLAQTLFNTGQMDKAESEARKAIELYPTNAEHHCLLANILKAKKDLPGAVTEARRALELAYLYKERYEALVRSLEQTIAKPDSQPRQ
ncbi:MAG: O-antigen ligase family protein [bacterium]